MLVLNIAITLLVWEDNLNNVTGGNVQRGRMSVSASNTSRSGGRGRGGRGGSRGTATATFVSATGDLVTSFYPI
nr:hypothetical protein CFP56_60026 [Quercus suber]